MELKDQPLVSVVTPVYNGERFLAECVESVLAQTYGNWELIIVNNRSADRTLEIAGAYGARDSRIRVHDNASHMGVLENHNHALRLMSPASRYCVVLHADDMLLPECLTRKVELAEARPSVGAVGSYWIHGDRVSEGPPYPATVVPGRDVCRMYLSGERDLLGPPATMLIRSDIVRSSAAFFNESNMGADKEAVCDVLSNADFGFVHQVLAYYRSHGGQTKRSVEASGIMNLGRIFILKKHGLDHMSKEEVDRSLKEAWRAYYGFLARHARLLREKRFMESNRKALAALGCPFSPARLMQAASLKAAQALLSPAQTLSRIRARLRGGALNRNGARG